MVELGETGDPRVLVPGDPERVRATQASMTRLGGALMRAGDGLARVDSTDWTGQAADSFRAVFDGVPAQWTGSGEAFLAAADALADHGEVLDWAQRMAGAAIDEWTRAQVTTFSAADEHERAVAAEAIHAGAEQRPPTPLPFVDPGDAGRAAAVDRLRRARDEVRASGDEAAGVLGWARDLAPPAPTVAQQIAAAVGDFASGAWATVAQTGQFLWQIDPARFIVEPAEAVQGWQDLGTGVAYAATHPAQAIEAALNPREMLTNPTRWAGGLAAGVGLSALAGSGAAGRVARLTRAAEMPDGLEQPGGSAGMGRWGGLTAAEHATDRGRFIGRPASSKKAWVREVDDPAEVRAIFDELSRGGRVVPDPTFGGQRVELPDGTNVGYRESSGSTHKPVVQIHVPGMKVVKVHLPKDGE